MAKKKRKFSLKKKNGKLDLGRIIELIVVLVVVIWLGSIAWDVFGIGPNNSPQTVSVQSGNDFSYITDTLKEQGIIKHPFLFKAWAKVTGYSGKVQTGTHTIDRNQSYQSILKELAAKREGEVSVTFPEGLEIYKVCDLFVENELMTEDEFYHAVNNETYDYWFLEGIDRENKLEGYLYPDTYFFARTETPKEMLTKLLDNFEAHMKESYRTRAKELDMTFDQVVILASVIEREASGPSDEKLVSSVFHNRIKSDEYPYLQSCATVQYVLKERKAVLSEKDIQIDSKYNTYKYKGLPIGPISSVPVDAIEAALYPQQSDYYFFGLNQSGVQVFSKTYEEHLANLKKS